MQRESVLYGVIGLLVGVVGMMVVNNYSSNREYPMMGLLGGQKAGMMGTKSGEGVLEKKGMIGMGMGMDAMVETLEGKTGDEFDETFLKAMIVHHQGAVEMAGEALENTKHAELRDMANDIISAQNAEIEQMQKWQKEWGYENN